MLVIFSHRLWNRESPSGNLRAILLKTKNKKGEEKQYFEEVTMRYGFKGLSRLPADKSQLEFLRERIDALHEAFERTSSATVGYYYYFLSVEYHQLQNNLEES